MPIGRRRPLLRAAAVGGGAYAMGKRNARVQEEQQAQAYEQGRQEAAPPPPPAAPAGAPVDPTVEKINQLAQLHASGALTDEEFAAAKARALGI
ncbi:MAG TPA: SHOCT domain-containing protein [Solirubrobacteraceae bacterium]|nr:SHOCT domain-containing protein [Solirubrobacteraceae bacterium]